MNIDNVTVTATAALTAFALESRSSPCRTSRRAVRCWRSGPTRITDHYWQVYFDTNRAIVDTFGAAGYPVPEEHVHMRSAAAAAGASRG